MKYANKIEVSRMVHANRLNRMHRHRLMALEAICVYVDQTYRLNPDRHFFGHGFIERITVQP